MICTTAELLLDHGLSGIDLNNFSGVQRRKYDTIVNVLKLFIFQNLSRDILVQFTVFDFLRMGSCMPVVVKMERSGCGKRRSEKRTDCGNV